MFNASRQHFGQRIPHEDDVVEDSEPEREERRKAEKERRRARRQLRATASQRAGDIIDTIGISEPKHVQPHSIIEISGMSKFDVLATRFKVDTC